MDINSFNITIDENEYIIVIKRMKMKNITLRLKDNNIIEIHCNKRTTKNEVEKIIRLSSDWIRKELNKREKNTNIDYYNDYLEKDRILLYGKSYRLIETKDKKNDCMIDCNNLLYYKNININKILLSKKTFLEHRFNEILSKTNKKAFLLIKPYKSCWGKCKKDSRIIILNLKLIHLEQKYIDEVIYHEITHLDFFNHSRDFYKELAKYCPNYKEISKEMKKFSFLVRIK